MFDLISVLIKDKTFIHSVENKTAEINFYSEVSFEEFDALLSRIKVNGEIIESRKIDFHTFAAVKYNGFVYYINFYENINELYVVKDFTSSYLTFSSPIDDYSFTPEITQINLEEFGLSYVVRLSNGKFIVFDAGFDFPPDHEKLYNRLKKGSQGQPICVAAWVLTHAHSDHLFGFVGFMSTYGDCVKIEKLLFNFPNHDDYEHYPELLKSGYNTTNHNAGEYIQMLYEIIDKYNIDVCTPHTGQVYNIADAVCEIIASIDDTIHCSTDLNSTSTVIRMELQGQVILWTADASLGKAKLDEKHGNHLKSDILQIPHHGYDSGKESVVMRCYDLIKPRVCLMPVASFYAYTVHVAGRESVRYLYTKLGVEEVIAGDPERTIQLPYTPPLSAKQELRNNVVSGYNKCGASTWVFMNLNTSNPLDFKFTLLNLTNTKLTVDAELFFETKKQRIRFVRAEVDGFCVKQICLTDDSVQTEDVVYYNPSSMQKRGIPENTPFAIRFMSDKPFVVSNEIHNPTYYTQAQI